MPFLPGKLPNAVLEALLARAAPTTRDPRVLVGPRVGEDAAVLDFGATCLIVATDPVTFATDQLGWYVVQVNANDIAVRGARPRWFLVVLLLPERHTDETLVSLLFDQIYNACDALGCTLIGGHTEITIGLERPLAIGQMIGEVSRAKLVSTGGVQVGDTILLTKGIAIEGAALLARERENVLRERGLAENLIARAKNFLYAPGLSVVSAALRAQEVAQIHAMHDPTEGGLATGLAELAQASNVGLVIERAAIPILPECQAICGALGLDPLGTLASGALLLAVSAADAARVQDTLARDGIPCAPIGVVAPRAHGLKIKSREGVVDLPTFARDEVARALEQIPD
ncbi:MAG: hydrogenase expression/formation protein [Chloroflexi bacterium]|nr:hydrogenase expression/formation protein [Chloroflexota bacterium]